MDRTTTGSGTMGRLREATHEHHRRAETHPVEQAMIRGTLPQEVYRHWLGQRLLLHRALDRALTNPPPSDPRVAAVVRPEQLRAADAEADFVALGGNVAELVAGAATRRAIGFTVAASQRNDASLLGILYVLEGSKNGAKYIARAVQEAYGLSPDATRYLDPHGDMQRPLWENFKTAADTQTFNEADTAAMVAAAQHTFDLIREMDDDLAWSAPTESLSR